MSVAAAARRLDRCGCCGRPAEDADPLVAACDVLVLRALERVGDRIVRARAVPGDRLVRREQSKIRVERIREEGRPVYEAHTLWPAEADDVDMGLRDAWGATAVVLAAHGCCGAEPAEVAAILDRYCRDLLATGGGHDVRELRYRLSAYLGLPA